MQSIASQSEVAALMERLSAPPEPAPAPVEKPLATLRQELVDRVRPAVQSVWPPDVTLDGFEVAFGTSGIVVQIEYESARDFDPVTVDVLKRALANALATPQLELRLTRTVPGKAPGPTAGKRTRPPIR